MRLGLLIPSSNTTMEPEFYQSISNIDFPVTLHSSRLKLKNVDSDSLNKMEEQLIPEAMKLKDADVDFMIYGCTSGSLLHGKAFSDKLIEQMDLIIGERGKSTTTSQCVLNALSALDVNKILVLTPYLSAINKLERIFLENNGFHVIKIAGMNIKENTAIGRVTKNNLLKFVMQETQGVTKPDLVFISCTNLPTFDLIKNLEKILDTPVVSSNSASLFEFLSKHDIPASSLNHLGRLYSI
jgi:maleate isomerase